MAVQLSCAAADAARYLCAMHVTCLSGGLLTQARGLGVRRGHQQAAAVVRTQGCAGRRVHAGGDAQEGAGAAREGIVRHPAPLPRPPRQPQVAIGVVVSARLLRWGPVGVRNCALTVQCLLLVHWWCPPQRRHPNPVPGSRQAGSYASCQAGGPEVQEVPDRRPVSRVLLQPAHQDQDVGEAVPAARQGRRGDPDAHHRREVPGAL